MAATQKANHDLISKYSDKRLKEFKNTLSSLMLELAKLIVKDGEGASKFITINVTGAHTKKSAKKIAFSIANSPLVKTAIAGEDANWGRIIMAIGKANVNLNLNKLGIKFGEIIIVDKGQLFSKYEEAEAAEYMRGQKIDIKIDLNLGNKEFTAYTMDLTKKYIEINADYRS